MLEQSVLSCMYCHKRNNFVTQQGRLSNPFMMLNKLKITYKYNVDKWDSVGTFSNTTTFEMTQHLTMMAETERFVTMNYSHVRNGKTLKISGPYVGCGGHVWKTKKIHEKQHQALRNT